MATKNLQIVLELVDKASAQLKKVSGSFDRMGKSMNAAEAINQISARESDGNGDYYK